MIHRTIFLIILIFCTLANPLVSQDRVIKPGDSIDIVVYGHQELSRVVTVGADGTVDFPFMQNIPVDGMSIEELRRFMLAQLSKYLDGQPMVTVGFSEGEFIKVTVLGYVKQPGTVQLPLSGTLQESISQAGGPLEGAQMDKVTLIRDKDGQTTKRNYNLVFLNLLGDMRQNPVLQEGDIVLVTGNPIFAGVKVVGEVREPGIYEAFYGASILDMIFKAGGLNDDANISKVRYISPSRKKSREVIVDLDKYYKDPYHYELPMVQAGDIVIIPQKVEVWRTILSTIGDFSSIMLTIYYVARIQALR